MSQLRDLPLTAMEDLLTAEQQRDSNPSDACTGRTCLSASSTEFMGEVWLGKVAKRVI